MNYETATDYELTQACGQGNESAFNELYRRHRQRVYALCLKMLANTDDAQDLTQECFIQLFRKGSTFRGDSAFSTWMHRLVANQVKMHFRKRQRERETITFCEDPFEDSINARVALENLSQEHRLSLLRAINKLPPGYRRALVLHDIEGYDHNESARIMGCALGTSKSQLHKARVKMRKNLNKKFSAMKTNVRLRRQSLAA